ncbi:MAG: AAA family ATPase [Candidatus Micrarchaeota archaeon]
MANIFRTLAEEKSIFRDEAALRPDYMPDGMPGREREMKDMASFLQEAAKGRAPPSMLLVGSPGTGKTTISKFLLSQLCEVSSKPYAVYINCWENSTRFGILNKLVIELGDMLPRRGIATDEIVSRLGEIGRREKFIPIIILDEADRLLAGGQGEEKVLYDLSRAKEALGLEASVIAITNERDLPAKLDGRVRSTLTNHTIYFEQYSPTQLKEILQQRARAALWTGSYDEDVIGLCAGVGAKSGGDARLAIHLLWAAAKKAEVEGAKKITVEHVKAIKERSMSHASTLAERKMEELDEADAQLVEIISSCADGIDSGGVYEKFGAEEGQQRTVRNRLEKLEKAGLLCCEDAQKGPGGRTRIWRLAKR